MVFLTAAGHRLARSTERRRDPMIHALRLAAAMTLDHRPDAATATRHRTLAFGDRHF
jgi:hypothetical protein